MTYALCNVLLCISCVKIGQFVDKYLQQKVQLGKIHPVPENYIGIGVNVSDCLYTEIRTSSSLLLQ